MKKYSIQAQNNLEIIAEGETAAADLPKNPQPNIGASTAKKQIEQLTSREIEVLHYIAEGKLNKQVASELCLSIKTIEKHREHLSKKLGIRGIAGLTHFAIYAGITPCNPQLA